MEIRRHFNFQIVVLIHFPRPDPQASTDPMRLKEGLNIQIILINIMELPT